MDELPGSPDGGAREIYRDRPTSDEIAEVLGLRLTATVGTLNEDGSVHLAFVIFRYEEPHPYFETASITRKARNAADRHVTSMIVQGQVSTGRSLMVTPTRWRSWTGAALHAETRKELDVPYEEAWRTDGS